MLTITQTPNAFFLPSSTASSTSKKSKPKRHSRRSPMTKATLDNARAPQPGAADRLDGNFHFYRGGRRSVSCRNEFPWMIPIFPSFVHQRYPASIQSLSMHVASFCLSRIVIPGKRLAHIRVPFHSRISIYLDLHVDTAEGRRPMTISPSG